MISKFNENVQKKLGYYIYTYTDPINNKVFYVGMGKNQRCFDHFKDKKKSNKTNYIASLKSKEIEPKIEILSHGLDEKTAKKLEAGIIDLIGIDNLTNLQKGHETAEYGKMSLEQITAKYELSEITENEITEKVLMVNIKETFRYSMSEQDLYDVTRGSWKVSIESAKKVKLVFAIYNKVIQEIYEVKQWFQDGETFNKTRSKGSENSNDRYEFVGIIADEQIRKKYKYKSINFWGSQNPVKYINNN